jgi:type 2 lantibiotic biosynthesis protein LanM
MPDLLDEAEWHRATTLRERAASLCRDGAPVETDTRHAERRLGRWRAQTPFQKQEILWRRLAAEGLSPEDFRALLGEPCRRLRERACGPPPWLAGLAEACAGPASPARLAPAAAKKLDMVLVVEPVVVRARERLRTAAQRIVERHPQAPFDPETAVEAFFDLLAHQLTKALKRTLVLELHVASRSGLLRGATPEAQLSDFLDRLREPDFALGLLRQYPVAARHAVECADRWLAFASEMLEQLAADFGQIREAFTPAEDPGPLVQVQGGVSDPHRGERTVLLLRFRSGFRLVYKPKPLALDAAFQELLTWLNERGAVPAFRPLRILDRGAYGWVEFITPAGCVSMAEVSRFYQRQGGYLALFYALAATDFHYENLLAAGEYPVPIDLETLFHPRPAEVGALRLERLADEAVWDSVLRPGLLPQRIWARDNAGVDISGFGATAGQVTSVPVLKLGGGETDLPYFRREIVDMPVGAGHRPSLDGQEVDVRDHTAAIADGFAAVYRLLVRWRDDLLAPEGPLSACAEAPTRILVRPTIVYDRLLSESYHPYVLQDALDRDRLLDRLWVDVEARPGLERLLPWEHRDLVQGDIPLFTSRAGSRGLWASTGEHIPDMLPESGLARVREILLEMGEADLARQLRIVHGSLETLRLHSREALWPSYRFAEADLPAPADRFLAAARAVGDRLESSVFRQNGSATWLGFSRMGASGFWSFEPVGYGLYSGLSGIALFLGHLGAATAESRYTEVARAGFATVLGRVENDPGNWIGLGGFTGLGSILYTCLQLATVWGEPGLFAVAESIVEKLPERIERDETLDLIGGSAGCLLALLRLHALHPSPRTLAVALQCGERLLAQGKEMETGLAWLAPGTGSRPLAGLSHGAAGIAWALAELSAVTGEERFRAACRGALAYERSLFSAEKGNWPDLREDPSSDRPWKGEFMCAWCHGAPGIGLARLACLSLLPEPGMVGEIDVAVNTTLRWGFGGNHSLCHGDLGNLDLLLEAGRRLGREDLLGRVYRAAAGILQGIEERGWLSGAALAPEIPGLMTGLSGIGYQLLRLSSVETVPSVLLLEPPRGTGTQQLS